MTASTCIVLTTDALLRETNARERAFSSGCPRSSAATIPLDRAIWPQPKRAGTVSQSPMFYTSVFGEPVGAPKLGYWALKIILPLNPPLDPTCRGSVNLRGVPTAAGYARRRGRVIRDVKRGLRPLPSREWASDHVLPGSASKPFLAGLGTRTCEKRGPVCRCNVFR